MNLRPPLLVLGYGALIVYASLYPLSGWHVAGVDPYGFLNGRWTTGAPRADNLANVLAYIPLGLLVTLSLQGRGSLARRVILATLVGATLSFFMEFLQQFLPVRVPSQADLATNACGALLGALTACFLDADRLPGKLLVQWRMRWVKPGRQFELGLIVVAAWALSQWVPGVPALDLGKLREGLAPLWRTAHNLSDFDLLQWGRYTLYLTGLALLVRTLGNPGRPAVPAFFLFVACVFAYKIAVVGRLLSLEAVVGAFSAMALTLLWLALRLRTIATIAALFVLSGLICAHFLPGQDSPQHLSHWAPLRGPIDHPALGLGSVLEILWPPAALGYLAGIAAPPQLRRAVAWGGGAALAVLLVAMDWQRHSIALTTVFLMAGTWTLFGSLWLEPSARPMARPNVLGKRTLTTGFLTWGAKAVAAVLFVPIPSDAQSATIRVGPQRGLSVPSAAAKVAGDGDLIEIEAGVYAGDSAVWTQSRLTIRGVGGLAQLRADGAHAEGKAIWVIKGANTIIEHVEFSGAKVPDHNGAGIRLEGAGLTVRYCRFHHNETGILTGANPASDIVIEHSEFSHSMRPGGHSHNLYIGTVNSFTLRSSSVHHATFGHNVKSRALKNLILYNRIMDERDGRSSYAIEFPDGGLAFVIGNLIQQGPLNDNRTIVAYGAEGLKTRLNELYFVNNTVVNDDPRGGRFLFVKPGTPRARIVNNIFAGRGEIVVGPGELENNTRMAMSDFVGAENFDYRLKHGAAAIGRAVNPGVAHGMPLWPVAQYVHTLRSRVRSGSLPRDLGALQFDGTH